MKTTFCSAAAVHLVHLPSFTFHALLVALLGLSAASGAEVPGDLAGADRAKQPGLLLADRQANPSSVGAVISPPVPCHTQIENEQGTELFNTKPAVSADCCLELLISSPGGGLGSGSPVLALNPSLLVESTGNSVALLNFGSSSSEVREGGPRFKFGLDLSRRFNRDGQSGAPPSVLPAQEWPVSPDAALGTPELAPKHGHGLRLFNWSF